MCYNYMLLIAIFVRVLIINIFISISIISIDIKINICFVCLYFQLHFNKNCKVLNAFNYLLKYVICI